MRTAASLRHRAGADSEELGWVHAHFHERNLAGAPRATNIAENREHRRRTSQRGTNKRAYLVFLALARRRSYDGADQLCSSLANDLFGDLANLGRGAVEGDHRCGREKAQGLALIEKTIGVVSGSPAHERLPQSIGNRPDDEAGVAWTDEGQCVEPPPSSLLWGPQFGSPGQCVCVEDDGGGVTTVHVWLSSRRRNNDRRA